MVLLTRLSTKVNKIVAPFLLRKSLSARYILGRGIYRDNPILDSLLLLPLLQQIISIEVQGDAIALTKKRADDEENNKKEKNSFDQFVDRVWDQYLEPIHPDKGHTDEIKNTKPKSNNLRLHVLESYLRPILTNNNEWWEIPRWQFNHRFKKWARGEYLIAKYGLDVKEALRRYPSLKVASLQQAERRRRDSVFSFTFMGSGDSDELMTWEKDHKLKIPSFKHVIKAFSMENWNRMKVPSAEYKSMKEIAIRLGGTAQQIPGTNIVLPDITDESDLSKLSLEELLEVTGCHVAHCGSFNALCEEGNIYEFWTRDYVTKLASYLLDRSEEHHEGNTTIIDVGAGDGTLAYFLRNALVLEKENRRVGYNLHKAQKKGIKMNSNKSVKKGIELPTVVATDDGSWSIESQADIERLTVVEAMNKYGLLTNKGTGPKQQVIVICSWMPMGEDWTQDIRNGGADEYILIGECDDGNCGNNWLTWGNIEHYEGVREENTSKLPPPPYIADGFERIDMEQLSVMQFSRFDSNVSSASKTVCFRKGKRTIKS